MSSEYEPHRQALERARAWQIWLQSGEPLTAESAQRIIADVLPRCSPELADALREIAKRAVSRGKS